jgi:hypothetical protein
MSKEQLEMLALILIDAFIEGVNAERVFGQGEDDPKEMANDWISSTSLGKFVALGKGKTD